MEKINLVFLAVKTKLRIIEWNLNNWKSANKKPVKNKDLWVKLDNCCQKHDVSWKWVKAHSGNKLNNLVDELAVLKAK
jgi:ribonuclease HI